MASLPDDLFEIQTQQLLQDTEEDSSGEQLDYLLSQFNPEELDRYVDPSASNTDSTYSYPNFDPDPAKRTSPSHLRFAAPKSDAELQEARDSAVPKNTAKNTSWARNVWREWTGHRRQCCQPMDCPPHILLCTSAQLDYWLSKFVLEVRRRDGQPYPPNSMYQLTCGLLRWIREMKPALNLFADAEFAGFRKTLDGEMKRLRSMGLGVQQKRAEPISEGEENQLWEKGLLGDHSPQVLLDTLVYLCGLYFALRSGQEHRNLQFTQFKLVEQTDSPSCLVYTENASKNNKGGIAQRKVAPKEVTHYANTDMSQRCLVRLFKEYCRHCPPDCKPTAFYLTPLRKPKSTIWFSSTPVGHNTLNNTVKRLCKAAGIEGFKTNHSLRVSAATRLFRSGVDEQLIMSRTGHRSLDGVRTYKRVSEEQKMALSSILNATTNGCKQQQAVQPQTELHSKKPKLIEEDPGPSLYAHAQHASSSLNLHGCHGITINFATK